MQYPAIYIVFMQYPAIYSAVFSSIFAISDVAVFTGSPPLEVTNVVCAVVSFEIIAEMVDASATLLTTHACPRF
jgi:hypothetical protein